MKIVFTCALLLNIAGSLLAQGPDLAWQRTYGDRGFWCASAVQQLADFGFMVAGRTFDGDFFLMKTDLSGECQWSRNYGGTAYEELNSAQQTTDGGFALFGFTHSYGAGQDDFWLVKTNPTGSPLWSRAYGGLNYDQGLAMQQTSDDRYIITGYTMSFGAGYYDYYLVMADASGNPQWTRTFGGGGDERAYAIQQTADHGFVLVGHTDSYGAGAYDFYVVKTDSVGILQWSRTYGGTAWDQGLSVQQTTDGGYILAGITYSYGAGNGDYWLVKISSVGDTLWTQTFGGLGRDEPHSVRQTPDGGYVVAGNSTSFGAGGRDIYVVKTDQSGNMQWSRTYGSAGDDGAQSIQKTIDDCYILVGWSGSTSPASACLVKTARDVILPVELTSFSAASASSGIRLSFTVASETNNDFFEIMRGTTEAGEFNRIATLPSQGNSATGHSYEYLDREVAAGQTYWYYLADVDLNGNRTEHRELMRSATMTGSAELPSDYALSAYPNPFNPSTTISFALPEADVVQIAVFNVAGRWIQTLVNEKRGAGNHTVSFDARDLPSGVYFARMESGRFAMTKKMLLIR